MKIHLQPDDAAPQSQTGIKQAVQGLHVKARAFIAALELETGLRVKKDEQQNLEMALLKDFLEIHNAALTHAARLPETKAEIDRLIGH
ncbi:MAG: hypothetical protein ACYCZX_03805 [Rhodospirillaceae bacterium]